MVIGVALIGVITVALVDAFIAVIITTRVWTQLIQKQRAVTRQTAARKLRASLS
jgi:hypothetical protein